jgi:mono/diheme cytochrome c family protein
MTGIRAVKTFSLRSFPRCVKISRLFATMLRIPIQLKPALAILVALVAVSCSSASSQPNDARSTIPKNPQKATQGSIATGKRIYQRHCESCHGLKGDGVGAVAMQLTEAQIAASDLTDDDWEYGSTDGEIFLNIRKGLGIDSVMRGINGKAGIYPEGIWDTVNYVRSLHRSPTSGSAPAAPK